MTELNKYMLDGFENQILLMCPNNLIREMLTNDIYSKLLLTDIGYYPNARRHFCSRPTGTDVNILIYNTDGTGFCRTGYGEYSIPPDHFILLPADHPHIYGSESGWNIYWFHFSGSVSSTFVDEFNLESGKPYPVFTKSEEIIQIFENIFSTLQMGFSKQSISYASTALWHLIGCFLYRNRALLNNQYSDPVEDSIKYMKENLSENLTLNDLAEIAGYSASYYTGIFTRKTGSAPVTYFINLKMHLASQYLHETSKPIKEIAYILGYNCQYYFSRLFKKHIGISPSKYRETRIKSYKY